MVWRLIVLILFGSWFPTLLACRGRAQTGQALFAILGLVLLIRFLLVAYIARVCGNGSCNSCYVGHAPDDTHDAREVPAIAHSELERQNRSVAVLLLDRDVVDVRFGAGDCRSHRREH